MAPSVWTVVLACMDSSAPEFLLPEENFAADVAWSAVRSNSLGRFTGDSSRALPDNNDGVSVGVKGWRRLCQLGAVHNVYGTIAASGMQQG